MSAEVVGNVVVVLGALVFASAALGLLRFPDAYTRISAVGTAGGIGVVLLIGGAVLIQPTPMGALLAGLAIVLQLATSAVGSMAVARSAYLTRSPLRRCTFDELATDQPDDESRGA